jgi:putative ABC transport system ATP-binding protein
MNQTLTQDVVLSLDTISKVYGKGHTAVKALADVTFQVPRGSYWSIMGPSGSGKSTLLHLLGLLDRPTDGTIHIDATTISKDTNISALSSLRSEYIGFVFQQFFLLPRLSALENVILPALYRGRPYHEAQTRALELLTEVGLAGRTQHFPNQLSGGEQQRVAIARALVNNPAIILADEPTGNLDSKSGKAILELIENLHTTGKTILVVTHDGQIGKRAKKIVQLRDGRLEDIS